MDLADSTFLLIVMRKDKWHEGDGYIWLDVLVVLQTLMARSVLLYLNPSWAPERKLPPYCPQIMDLTDVCKYTYIFIDLTRYRDAHKLEGIQRFLQERTWNISSTANISRVCKFKTDGRCLDNSKDASLVPLGMRTGRFDTVVSVFAGSSEKPQIQEPGRPGKGRHAPLSQRSNLQPRGVPGRVQCDVITCSMANVHMFSHLFSLRLI